MINEKYFIFVSPGDDLEDLHPILPLHAKVQALKEEFPRKIKDQKETAQNQHPEAEVNQKVDLEVLQADLDDKNVKEADPDPKTEGTRATVAVTVAAEAEHRREKADHQKIIEEVVVEAIAMRRNHHRLETMMIADENPLLGLEGVEVGTTTIEDQEDLDQEATQDI